jgi:hypothetical protein
MLAKFVRFKKDMYPAAPGWARNDIDKARLKPPEANHSDPRAPVMGGSREEVMDEIDVGDVWVILRAVRFDEKRKRQVLCERFVHVSSVRDWEPLDEDEERKPAKGGKGT